MNTKKELDGDWIDTMETLESLRKVIVKQRKKWQRMIAENIEFDNVKKLYKDSEALEHMINRIENGMTKSQCTITFSDAMKRITSGGRVDTEK
jgi:hypothetical protein